MKKTFLAFVRNRETREKSTMELEAVNKTQALRIIRAKGYSVSNRHCKEKDVYEWILDAMDDAVSDVQTKAFWHFNEIPADEEEYKRLLDEYTEKEITEWADRKFRYNQKKHRIDPEL